MGLGTLTEQNDRPVAGRTGALSCAAWVAQRPWSRPQAWRRAQRSPRTLRSMRLIEQNQKAIIRARLRRAPRAPSTCRRPRCRRCRPATVQTTEQAVERYDAIVARGGWPQIPPSTRLQLGNRHPSVIAAARSGSPSSGDLDPNAGRYRRFRFLRRGRGAALPGAPRHHRRRHRPRRDASRRSTCRRRCGLTSSRSMSRGCARSAPISSPRFVVCNIPAAQIEAIENGVAVSPPYRGGRQARPAVARDQQQDRRDQLQSVLDRAGLDRAART